MAEGKVKGYGAGLPPHWLFPQETDQLEFKAGHAFS